MRLQDRVINARAKCYRHRQQSRGDLRLLRKPEPPAEFQKGLHEAPGHCAGEGNLILKTLMLNRSCPGPTFQHFGVAGCCDIVVGGNQPTLVAVAELVSRPAWCLSDPGILWPRELVGVGCAWPPPMWNWGLPPWALSLSWEMLDFLLGHTYDVKCCFKLSNRTKKHLFRKQAAVPPRSSRGHRS